MANNSRDFHIKFLTNIDLNNFKKAASSMQSILSGIDLDSSLESEFNKLFKNLNKELDNFVNLTEQEFNNIGDVKKIESSHKELIKLYDTLQKKINDINNSDISPIYTQEELKRVTEITDQLTENNKKLEEVNRGYTDLKSTISSTDFSDSGINKLVIDLVDAAEKGKDYSTIVTKIEDRIKKSKNAFGEYSKEIKEVSSNIRENEKALQTSGKKISNYEDKLRELNTIINSDAYNDTYFAKLHQDADDAAAALANFNEEWEKSHTTKKGRVITTGREQATNSEGVTYKQLKINSNIAQQNLKKAEQERDSYNNSIKETRALLEQEQAEHKKLEAAIKSSQDEYDRLVSEQKDLDTKKLQDFIAKIKNLETATELSTEEIEQLQAELRQLNNAAADRLVGSLEQLKQAAESSQTDVRKLNQDIKKTKESAEAIKAVNDEFDDLYRRAIHFFSIENSIEIFTKAVRQAFESVKELDAAMTDIAVVTDFDIGDVWETIPEYTDMANELGTTILGAYETAKLYYQQGLTNDEVMDASVETMKMARIANMDYAEATDYMTAAVRGFKLEMTDASKVNDVFSKLAAITASDTQEIADALTRTASIANAAGMSLETTSAFLTQMINFATYTRVA